MLNEEDYVSFDTAKMLKNKGFDEFCRYTYMENENSVGITVSTNSKLPKEVYSMPTLWEAQKYLREKHNCYIQITYEAYKTRVNYLVQVLFYEPNDDDCWSNESTGMYGDNAEFKTYEEALNFGILEALKRI